MDYDLIVPYIPNLRRYARALVGDRDGADDLVQDTLERAVRKFHLWRPGDLRAWLFSIMHNVFVNQLKARKIGLDVEIDDSFPAPPTPVTSLDLQDMQRALATLAPEQREVVLLVALEDMSYADVSRALGIPMGTVMSRLSRGRERLRRVMGPGCAEEWIEGGDMNEREDAQLKALLKKHFDPVATEPIPARMYLRKPAWMSHARSVMLVAVGIGIGVAIPLLRPHAPAPLVPVAGPATFPMRAARAHAVYAPEVRHPVEVDAKEQEHLVKWLSKRLGLTLKVPVLATEGFELLGGRLLPGPEGPVAQFMYQDSAGKRLTLYVSKPSRADTLTAFRFAQDGPVSVFYWMDRECGYALSGELDRGTLTRIATSVYKQLEP